MRGCSGARRRGGRSSWLAVDRGTEHAPTEQEEEDEQDYVWGVWAADWIEPEDQPEQHENPEGEREGHGGGTLGVWESFTGNGLHIDAHRIMG
jgi:hypothetical protein